MLELLLGIWLAIAPQNIGTLQGTIKRGGTSEPVGGVELTLIPATPTNSGTWRTNSDPQGRFTFENVPLGKYTLRANREGYFTYPGGMALPSVVSTITVESVQTQQVVIDIVPGAVFAGRITDTQGRPLSGVGVSAMKLQYDDGRRAFNAGSVAKMTDDRGQYRLYWFAPGEYLIRADAPAGLTNLARKTYYPGTVDSTAAATLTIRGGETLDGLDLALPPTSSIKISGTVAIDGAGPSAGAIRTFYLLPRDGRPAELYPPEFTNRIPQTLGQNSSDFVLEVYGLTPGSYDLAPFYIDRDNTFHTGRTQVEIGDRDIENVRAVIHPNVDVKGRIAARGDFRNWSVLQVQLRAKDVAVPLTKRSTVARIETDGSFTVPGIVEGRYQLYLGASGRNIPSDLYISELKQGALDIRDEGTIDVRAGMLPLEITLSSGAGKVHGVIEAPGGRIPERADVVLVPQTSRRQNLMFYDRTLSDPKGQFDFDGIPPGEYKVFAFEQLPDSAEQNAQFIARYDTLGQPVTINTGTAAEIKVRLLQ